MTDSAGNNATANFIANINPTVSSDCPGDDASTGAPLSNATVQVKRGSVDDQPTSLNTDNTGKAVFDRVPDRYTVFVMRAGYSYYLNESRIDADTTFYVALQPQDTEKPVVTLLAPENDSAVTVPVTVSFTVQDTSQTTCVISLAKDGEQWFQQAGTQTVADSQTHSFSLTSLEEASYQYMIECTDASGNVGDSERRSFTVGQAAPSATDAPATSFGNDSLSVIDRAYGAYDSFTSDQKTLADLLGWEETIKQQQRTIERAQRDIQALQFRNDLSDAEKAQQQTDIQNTLADAQNSVPVDLAILESRTQVSYPTAQDLANLSPAIRQQKGYAFTDEQLATYLQTVQQEFTVETTLDSREDGARRRKRAADQHREPQLPLQGGLNVEASQRNSGERQRRTGGDV